MLKFTLNLSEKYRLNISVNKRRDVVLEKPLIANLKKILKSKRPNKHNLILRKFFEHPKTKKIFGINIAFFLLAASFFPKTNIASSGIADITETSSPIVLETQIGVRFPLNKISITQGFSFFHPGIDLDGVTGDPVYPIMSGKVESTGKSRFGYGNEIVISHGNGITSLYAHLSKIEVNAGQEVNINSEIGKVGATGHASGDHLHLEIHDDGKAINPLSILSK